MPKALVRYTMRGPQWRRARTEWLYGPLSRRAVTRFVAPEVLASPAALEQNFGQIGTMWDGGPANGVNGLASERGTFTSGTGGPEGDHVSTVADDFEVPGLAAGSGNFILEEFRPCLYHPGTSAEMYLFLDDGGSPPTTVTDVIFGRSSTNGLPKVVSTSYQDNTSRCQAAFGYPGRQFAFNEDTTGVIMPTVPEGIYWLAVIGEGGSRAFWADSGRIGLGAAEPGQWSLGQHGVRVPVLVGQRGAGPVALRL